MWRLAERHSVEDVMQEAYLKFLELKERYDGKVDNPSWFMSLYKTSVMNRITDLAKSTNKLRRQENFSDLETVVNSDGEDLSYEETVIGLLDNDALFELLVEEAPEEVRQVLALLSSGRQDLLEAVATTWTARGRRRQDGNRILCFLLGYDPKYVDLVQAVIDYFEEEDYEDDCYEDNDY